MGLHNLTDTGIEWHCPRPECSYHNCSAWASHLQCAHHDTPRPTAVSYTAPQGEQKQAYILQAQSRISGNTHQIPVDHPDIAWVDPHSVVLPACEECGSRMTVKVVFTDEELQAPNLTIIERDKNNPNLITNVYRNPQLDLHLQFADKLKALGNTYQEGNT